MVPLVRVRVHFYSYFKDLAGAAEVSECVASGSTVEELLRILFSGEMKRVVAIGKRPVNPGV
ncbi:MAG TPA: hypothetical protein VMR33_03970 [Candidatus Baltobacteraceae bacterium]|jgi:molybdopterin converting factor small subunit|nr:hypothetical protein [Candidatus Baltobacteraceae bacterium]